MFRKVLQHFDPSELCSVVLLLTPQNQQIKFNLTSFGDLSILILGEKIRKIVIKSYSRTLEIHISRFLKYCVDNQ
jgi:hypothetical protein